MELQPGLFLFSGYFDRPSQEALSDEIRSLVQVAPLFHPKMPKTGKTFSVRMSNCGPLGWVADKDGYRYQVNHPTTQEPWPPMPQRLQLLWRDIANCELRPEACLINYYSPEAKMGLHQDRDEDVFGAPVISVSLGDDCRFRIGSNTRGGPTKSLKLHSGDVLVMSGQSRLAFHGVDKIYPGTSTLLKAPGRINLTLRRVTSD
ncbi:MAG: alpha-ketoglutarate-dependent dioxygenase AlkB [Hyphomicrobiales bacterium]